MSEEVFHAASRGDVRQLRLLIRKGHMEDVDESGNTPLIVAAKHNRVAAVALLIDRKANIAHVNAHGNTAMHVAAEKGIMHVSVIRLLFEAGANISVANSVRETPISLITKNAKLIRHPKIAPILAQRDAAKFHHKRRKDVKLKKSQGKSANRVQSKAALGSGRRATVLNAFDASNEDVLNVRQVWEALTGSADSNVHLTAKNLSPIFTVLNISMGPADDAAFMDLIDVNQDGCVDFDDFYVSMMWRKLSDSQEVAAIDVPFDALDTCLGAEDATGLISRSGFRAAERVMGPALFADNDRDINRILSSLIPNYSNLAKMDANTGIDRKTFARIVSGKHEIQAAPTFRK